MKKKKTTSFMTRLTSFLSLACSGTLMICGAVLAIGSIIMLKTNDLEGWDGFGAALGGVILMIIGIVYAIAGIIPCLLKTVGVIKPKIVFPILGLPFDLAYTIANVVMMVSIVSSGVDANDTLGLIIVGVMTIVSLAGITLDALNIAFIKKDRKKDKINNLENTTENIKGEE